MPTDQGQIEKFKGQAVILTNKVKKKFRHISKRYGKQNIEVFRLYDRDIPEIMAVVDLVCRTSCHWGIYGKPVKFRFFCPEPEFFIFDDVRFNSGLNFAFYEPY